MKRDRIIWPLDFLMNAALLQQVEEVRLARPLRSFQGCVYQLTPGTDERPAINEVPRQACAGWFHDGATQLDQLAAAP